MFLQQRSVLENLRNCEITSFHLPDHSLLSEIRRFKLFRHAISASTIEVIVYKRSPLVGVEFPLFSLALRRERKV